MRVCVLGELVVETSGGAIELTGSWRARSLFAWLALNPGGHPRSSVAIRFWPDVLDSSARASLRNALWALRRALGPGAATIVATRDRVGLEGAWTDVGEFRRLADAGDLAAAAALWEGEPLGGLDEE